MFFQNLNPQSDYLVPLSAGLKPQWLAPQAAGTCYKNIWDSHVQG